jgi:hypothetical protein
MRPVPLLLVLLAPWCGSPAVPAEPAYLDELVASAEAQGLATAPGWETLGHYRPNLLGRGRKSLIDSESFFLAKDGKSDPASELEATLAAFFAPAGEPALQHPQCRFVARYRWLKDRLGFDPDRLPEQDCAEFDAWLATIDATSVTLIFPAAYLNNPASMFGHTLLRFDRPDQTEETRLLSHAVNYGAWTGTDNGVLFAVLGLTGGYEGTYSVEPYYELVKRYSDLENRDIWEYQLDFSPTEVERMLAHLWELRDQHSDYYFFDENCSYQLLFLLDAARPKLDLVGDFDLHVIPADSVRSVVRREGLLRHTVFRPSGETRLQQGLVAMPPADRKLVRGLASGAISPEEAAASNMSPPRLAAVLELAEASVTHELRAGDLERDVAAPRAWSLLAARSEIAEPADRPPVPVPATRPDQGHGSARLAAGIGVRDGDVFQALRLRPAYHDGLDPAGGFARGAGIEALDLELRHYQGDNSVVLDRFTAVRISSMAPRDELIRPVSWRLDFGLERMRVERGDTKGALVGVAEGGAGLGYGLGQQGVWSAMADIGLSGGEDCDRTCSVNLGPVLSLLWPITDRATFTASGSYQVRFGERVRDGYELRLGQSYGLAADLAIKVELALEDQGGGMQPELLSTLNWYF